MVHIPKQERLARLYSNYFIKRNRLEKNEILIINDPEIAILRAQLSPLEASEAKSMGKLYADMEEPLSTN